jgi:hypothetical protein
VLYRDVFLGERMSKGIFHVEPDFVPVVVIDSSAGSAYVKLSDGQVATTIPLEEGEVAANLDLDAGQRIVGFEVTGVHEFNLKMLIAVARLGEYFTQEIIDRAVYVRSETDPVVEPVLANVPESNPVSG